MIPWLCNSPTTPLQWVMTNSIPTDKSSKLPKKICYVNSKYILFVTLFQFGIFVSFESKWPIIELSHRVLFDCVLGVSKLLGIFVSKIDIWLIAVAAWDWLVYLSERRERDRDKASKDVIFHFIDRCFWHLKTLHYLASLRGFALVAQTINLLFSTKGVFNL